MIKVWVRWWLQMVGNIRSPETRGLAAHRHGRGRRILCFLLLTRWVSGLRFGVQTELSSDTGRGCIRTRTRSDCGIYS